MSDVGKPTHKLSFEEMPLDHEDLPEIKKGTDADAQDMIRMGKKQVLRVSHKVNFKVCGIQLTVLARESSVSFPSSVSSVFSNPLGKVPYCKSYYTTDSHLY